MIRLRLFLSKGCLYRSLAPAMAFVAAVIVHPFDASAQQPTIVQLPTTQNFSMTTSLLVPDRGSVLAGRNAGSRQLRRQVGGSGVRSSGVSTGSVSVSVYVHDLEALDAAVMAEGRRRRLARGAEYPRNPASSSFSSSFSSSAITLSGNRSASLSPAPPTINDVRGQVSNRRLVQHERARRDFALAVRLLEKGKAAAAQSLLRSALSRADADLQKKIKQQLAGWNSITRR